MSGARPEPGPAIDRAAYGAGMEQQLAAWHRRREQGMPRLGWKLGINVPEVMTQFGVPHGAVGWLDGDRRLASGSRHAAPEGSQLRVEPELCFRLGAAVPAGAGAERARAAVEAVAPALELVDLRRVPDSLETLVASSMLHHATVLGRFRPPELPEGLGRELPRLGVDGQPGPPARPDLVAADPGELLDFAARFLAAFGESLEAGDHVISGSFTATAPPLRPGQRARADFGPLGSVEIELAR